MDLWRDDVHATTLTVAIGFGCGSDLGRAAVEAAAAARGQLAHEAPQLALIVAAGDPHADLVPSVRSVLGQIALAGGTTTGILMPAGVFEHGVLVVAFAPDVTAESGAACVAAADLTDAGRSAARLVMAGWPFRLQYPRGLTIAFAASGTPISFLGGWRQFTGPKMRTVCAVMPGRRVWGTPASAGLASVACLEASYPTGLGLARGFAPGARPHAGMLLYGAIEAATTALKRIDEHSTRLVMVFDTVARRHALGAAVHGEQWSEVLAEVGGRAPCVGWLCERVAGYGRGVRPVDEHGALLVAALGESTPAGAPE